MADSITYRIGAMFSAKGDMRGKVGAANKGVEALGLSLTSAIGRANEWGASMVRSSMAAAGAVLKVGAALSAAAAGGAAAALAKVGFTGNVGLEKMQNTVAGTLQLFGHSAGAADRLGTNVKVAAAAMMKIQDIADAAPGELQDIQMLFQNMLPGARAATGSMQRILDLTKNVSLFTPTLTGGDFKTAGSQISRMLSGGAGAEMETWRNLSPLIVSAGLNMNKLAGSGKIFAKSLEGADPEKITTAFNKLQKEDRFALIEKVLSQGGDELAAMYSKSWEGASASAKSSMRKVAMGFTSPLFNATKSALVKAGEAGGVFSKDRIGPMQARAEQIGVLLAVPLTRALAMLERGARYFQDNFNAVFNTMYHAFQVGGGIIKGAFAFGLAKMIAGAAMVTAAGAVRAGRGAVSMIGKGYNTAARGVDGVRRAGRAVGSFMDTFRGGSAIGNSLSLFTMIGSAFTRIAAAGVVLVPLLIVAGLAFAALSVGLIAVAGIAAYVASRWDELSGSIVRGFQDGTLTLRPLVTAALILWERLKKIGEAFIGGATGASMMEGAINMATSVVNGLAQAVVVLAQIAAGFIDMVGTASQLLNPREIAGGGDFGRIVEVMKSGLANDVETARKIVERRKKEGAYDTGSQALSTGEKAHRLADNIRQAADAAGELNLKNINPADIEDYTKKADQMMKDLFGGDSKTSKVPKRASVQIGTVNVGVDLRNTDPDRMMGGLMEPLRRIARMPESSPYDMDGM